MRRKASKTVSLVLGSGGARGLAHIGVIDWLAQNGYHHRIVQFLDAFQGGHHSEQRGDIGLFDLLSRSFDIMQNAISAVKLASYAPDIVIQIPRDTCASYEFYRAKEVIETGYRIAAKVIPAKLK